MSNKKDFKIIKVGDAEIKICIKPELNQDLIRQEFPNGLPKGPPPYDIV